MRPASFSVMAAVEKEETMEIRVLAIGDVVSDPGVDFLAHHLRPL